MKRCLFSAFAALYLFLHLLAPPALLARAEPSYGSYAYVSTPNVYFYSNEPEPQRFGVFLLPMSYYVRILSLDGDYYRVEYLTDGTQTQKLTGYCKKSDVVPVDYYPSMPYLYLTLEVTYTIDGANKNDPFSSVTFTCAYYGDFLQGTTRCCYVLRDGAFGYIPRPAALTYEYNSEYDDRMGTTHPPTDTGTSPLGPAQIVVIILLCLLIPGVAALILRPSKKQSYEDE
jgi:hypothetical protein